MTDPELDAVIQAAGRGERLGQGPKAFLALGGRTLLERAVEVMRGIASRVIVGAPPDDLERAAALCGPEVLVVPGGATRRDTLIAVVKAARARWVMLHDVVHPFVDPDLARRVLAAARAHGAAGAAVRSTSSAYHQAPGRPTVRIPSGEVWLIRKPVAFRRETVLAGIAGSPEAQEGFGGILRRAGQEVAMVPAEPWNIKITTAEDWRLAAAIDRAWPGAAQWVRGGATSAGGGSAGTPA